MSRQGAATGGIGVRSCNHTLPFSIRGRARQEETKRGGPKSGIRAEFGEQDSGKDSGDSGAFGGRHSGGSIPNS